MLAAAIGTALLAAGCSGAASTDQVWNHAFTTTSVVVDGAQRPLVADSTLTLTFTSDSVLAKAGCNTMFGTVTLDDATVTTTSPLGMTMMACEPTLMDQDRWISEFLSSRPTWQRDGVHLTLTSANTVIVLTDASSA